MAVLESEVQSSGGAGEVCALDPYAFQPGVGSRIAGLAVGQTGDDPSYVFHTDYVPAGRGHAHADLKFHGLSAKEGVLLVRVHLFRQEEERPRLVLVTSARIAFNRLVQNGGEFSIRFEAFSDCRYAIYGSVLGDTDARADGLEVTLRKPDEADHTDYYTEARNTTHGRSAAKPNAMLLSTEVPTMDGPVSQVATPAQLNSAHAQALLGEAALPPGAGAADRWALAYTVRALQAYGMLDGTARGLGFAAPADPVMRLLKARSVTADCAYAADGVTPAMAAREMVNYDFLWRSSLDRPPASGDAWAEEVEQALRSLLPGGLGVFTFRYDPTPAPVTQPSYAADLPFAVDRRDLERLTMILISRGHEVAQLRIVGDYDPLIANDGRASSAAGLIVRRALIPD